MDPKEWQTRVDLAACYRLAARARWTDLIYTHISARLDDGAFLMNPYGLGFHEITASSLVKVAHDGTVLPASNHALNRAGFVIHGGLLAARPDVVCVLHTHTRDGCAVAAMACGLLPLSQFAMFYDGRIGYHDYEGAATDEAERDRLAADLGPTHRVLVLRNHGLITVGRTIAEAYVAMDQIEKACAVQVAAMASGTPLSQPSAAARTHTAAYANLDGPPKGAREWAMLLRTLDREEPDYRT
ncbi:MAG: class II aldolase/adducin family protein [Alphaproteobacteria bacterium]|nr:class II aldolase/adducin family protein [Alphaproteobacteria bacterium]